MSYSTTIIEKLQLLADLQKERSIAILSETQQEMAQTSSFDEQAIKTHKTLTMAQKENPDFWILLPERFFDAFAIRNNKEFRKNHKIKNLIEWYIFNLEQPIYQLIISNITNSSYFSPSQTSAIIHFIASLTYLCQLRDIGIEIYAKAEMTRKDTRLLKNVATSYLARERLFLGLADENIKHKINNIKGSTIASIGPLNEILRKTKSGSAKSVMANISFPHWIQTFNNEINELHKSLQKTIKSLIDDGIDLTAQNTRSQDLDLDIETQLQIINNLPIFIGIPETTLRMILKGAHLIKTKKNDLFLIQGETLTRQFIVIDGWVKTYKTNQDGQESILQILGKKEAILDTGLFIRSSSNISAKTISGAVILSVPLSILKDYIYRNRELAKNLFTETQNRLNKLLYQYEQITMHTAIERVGWFFVNLYIETGLEGKPIKLPFDKSLIASYLNIKPETFSRVLSKFRKEGFVINKHEIHLPNQHALCKYCDPEMAVKCCRADSINCKPIQLARKQKERTSK